ALTREGDVVAALEEVLIESTIGADRQSGAREGLAHRGALEAGEPRATRTAGERIGPADHLDLHVRAHLRDWHDGMLEIPARAEQADFLSRRRGEDHGATRLWASGER